MRDRDLVRHHWPVELRPAFDSLFAIDDVMAEVLNLSRRLTDATGEIAELRGRLER